MRKVSGTLPAHLDDINRSDGNLHSFSKIVIIRMVDMVGYGILSTRLREEIPGGAVVEMTRISNMINTRSVAQDRFVVPDDLYSLLSVPTLSLLRAMYSPLLILGAISGDGLDMLYSSFTGKSVASASLYLSDCALTRQYRRMRHRTLHTVLFPPDLLTKLRAKRTLDRLKLEEARAWNNEIYATRDRTDCSMDVSNQDAQSILSRLSPLIKEVKSNSYR